MYFEGLSGEREIEKALEHSQIAADEGDAEGQVYVGTLPPFYSPLIIYLIVV